MTCLNCPTRDSNLSAEDSWRCNIGHGPYTDSRKHYISRATCIRSVLSMTSFDHFSLAKNQDFQGSWPIVHSSIIPAGSSDFRAPFEIESRTSAGAELRLILVKREQQSLDNESGRPPNLMGMAKDLSICRGSGLACFIVGTGYLSLYFLSLKNAP